MSEIDEYLIVKAHGIMSRLIPPQSLAQMSFSKELKDLVSLLLMTDYRPYIEKLEELSANTLSNGFKKVMINRFKELINVASGQHKKFIVEYARIVEFENVLKIISSKISESMIGKLEIAPVGIESINYESLIKAKELEQLFRVLKSYEPYNEFRDEVINNFIENKNLVLVDYELHRIRYGKLLELTSKIEFMGVSELRKLIGIEIDILNIFTVTAPMLYSFSPDLMKLIIIPGGYLLSEEKLLRALELKRRSEMINYLKGYRDIIEMVLDRQETKAYLLAQKKIRNYLDREKIANYASFFDVYMCMKRIEYEYRDLIQISYGVEYNLPRELLQRNLISY